MAATWSPFFWVRYGLYRMGIHNLLGLCLAVFSVSALAADSPVPRGNVSVTVNPTTGYYSSTNSTVRLPNGVSASPTSGLPVVSKYSGGLQQSIPTGITIDAIKKSAPLPAVVRATTQSVKSAAAGCLTSARCNVALMLAGAGLSALLDNLDWVMSEGGQAQKKSYPPANELTPCEGYSVCFVQRNGGLRTSNGIAACSWAYPNVFGYGPYPSSPNKFRCDYIDVTGAKNWDGMVRGAIVIIQNNEGIFPTVTMPVPVDDAVSAVDNNYNPEPSDWPALTPELKLDDVEITSAPTLSSNPKTTTIYDADGNPVEVQETNIWYDFDIRDNPSSSPALDLKTRQETKTYKNGALTGTTSTTATASAGATAAGGGGGGSNVNVDIPTDCEFMPTVCAFLDWFKNDDTPEDPDLSALIDNRDFTETYSVTGGSKQCPADYEFTVDFIGRTYGLSFEPACDFASKMYYFVMAAAYIFAAYITIGASRNG